MDNTTKCEKNINIYINISEFVLSPHSSSSSFLSLNFFSAQCVFKRGWVPPFKCLTVFCLNVYKQILTYCSFKVNDKVITEQIHNMTNN